MSGWCRLEHDAIDQLSKLGPIETATYIALLRHTDQNRKCFPSMARIGKVAGVSERRAREAIKKLIVSGLVKREARSAENGSTLSPLYYLPTVAPQDPAEQNDTGGCDMPRGGGTKRQEGAERNDPLTRTNITRYVRAPKKRFVKPSIEEVRAYCLERKNVVDPQQFFDHYESNGWKVGRNAMKSWQAAVRTWEKNGFSSGNGEAKKSEPLVYRA